MLIKLDGGRPTGAPFSDAKFFRLVPNVSFPMPLKAADIEPYGFAPYELTDKPDEPLGKVAYEIAPASGTDGTWRQAWALKDATPEEALQQLLGRKADLTKAVQDYIDGVARSHGYDSLLSACTYALSSVPRFKAEGEYCVAWRDAAWLACYDLLSKVQAGTVPAPDTLEQMLPHLPAVNWPAP